MYIYTLPSSACVSLYMAIYVRSQIIILLPQVALYTCVHVLRIYVYTVMIAIPQFTIRSRHVQYMDMELHRVIFRLELCILQCINGKAC